MFWILKADNGGNMEISKIIKEARIKKGMTQQQLADSVYVTRQTISKWELGKSIPDEASLNLLYQCLEINNEEKTILQKLAHNKQPIFLIVIALVLTENINLAKEDFDSFENSWDFTTHPFIKYKTSTGKLLDAYLQWENLKINDSKL